MTLALLALFTWHVAAQTILATKEKVVERRIIVRYPEGSSAEQLASYVGRLEELRGVRRAEALDHLAMAVVLCHTGVDEDAVLAAIDADKAVELAVPDSWVRLFDQRMCSSNPECKAFSLEGACCPAADGVRMACCSKRPPKRPRPLDQSTISLQSVHGGFITVSKIGLVGWRGKKTDPDAQFRLEAHPDGYVSLSSRYDTYLVTSPSGQLVAWHRGHREADDWEKFKLIYNSDDTISLRSKVSDKHVSLENSSSDMLSATTEKVEISERFLVTTRHGQEAEVPNDQRLSKLWAMDHFGDRDIDAVEAWKMFHPKTSEGLIVAVIDTGIDYTHPDLRESMWVNPHEIPGNGIDDDGNGIVDDVHGVDFANNDGDPMDDQMHGSHCGGTIAAQGNNSVGIAGVAWKGAKLMALKFLDASGAGLTSNAVKSMNYAVAMGARILSNSWGGGGSSSALRVAIERAEHAGALFVAAAGNDGLNNDELPSYPANYPMSNIISVASTTQNGDLSLFSCYGKTSVDVAAPGSDIYSTIPNGEYTSLSGTSMATPHVSGLAALIWMQRPEFSMIQVKEIILRSTVPEKALENACVTGGRINARRALALAAVYPAPRPPIHAPSQVAFVDTNPAVGRIGGQAVITAPEDQSDVDFYSLHFLSGAGVLMERIGQANVSSQRSVRMTLKNLTIPRFAKKIAAVAVNSSGRMAAATAAVLDIEDYGVPQDGARGLSFGGDGDQRVGRVAGELRIQRAGDEKTVSHYNIYWHSGWKKDLIGSVPSIGFLTTSCMGDCKLLNITYQDGVRRYHRDAYGNNEKAVITFSGPATVRITQFLTESYYDYLEIAGSQLSGTDLVLPREVQVPAGQQRITWLSDHSEGEGGWTFELIQEGESASFVLPEIEAADAARVEVVAAYGKTELWSRARHVDVADFDSESMAPSRAFLPSSMSFVDEHVDEGYVEGTVVLTLPPVHDVVSSYAVWFADAFGHALSEAWQLPVSGAASLQLRVPRMALPRGAERLAAAPQNAVGRGAARSWDLVDVVRSAPQSANFSGDEDPVELQIEGKVFITPARNPKNIIAYSVYLAEGQQKQTLLGRVAAAGRQVVTFKLHAAYKAGQSLLVVSSYADQDMQQGVLLHVVDHVEAYGGEWYDWGGYGADRGDRADPRRLQRRLAPPQPWLEPKPLKRRGAAQLLWSAEELPEALADGRLPRGRLAVFCVLTIHGYLQKSDGSPQFVPPSIEQRQGIGAALAENLPGVQRDQVKMWLGRAFKDASEATRAARAARASEVAKVASLVIDFEVLPPRSADADAIQLFFDRVEAKLILLSQGGKATARLASALGRSQDPQAEQLAISVGEPQQVAPRRGPSRRLEFMAEGPENAVPSIAGAQDVQLPVSALSALALATLFA